MKSNVTRRRFPTSPKEWDQLIAEAPGSDEPLDPEEEKRFWDKAVVVKSGGPKAVRAALDERARKRGERGPQKTPTKLALSLRLSPEVVAHFRATGAGWQTRIDEVLRRYVKRRASRD